MKKAILICAIVGVIPLLTACKGEYKGDEPTTSYEETLKNHIVGTIPTERNVTKESMKETVLAQNKIEEYKVEAKENGAIGWESTFEALNRALDEKLIVAYEWSGSWLTVYYNDGSSDNIIYSTRKTN